MVRFARCSNQLCRSLFVIASRESLWLRRRSGRALEDCIISGRAACIWCAIFAFRIGARWTRLQRRDGCYADQNQFSAGVGRQHVARG